jgi:hypothetical protein
MAYRDLLIKIAPTLRAIRLYLFGIRGRIFQAWRLIKPRSAKGTMVLLSLGGKKGSPYVASAVVDAGFDLCVVSENYPLWESRYLRKWLDISPFGNYEELKKKIAAEKPVAVLVEQRNILLPVKAQLNADLGLTDYGLESHKSSNSKVELRQAIDRAGEPNIEWCLLEDYQPGKIPMPFVIKPETGTGSRGITVIEKDEDFTFAMRKLESLSSDETVGGRTFIEAGIVGRQFDVEGVYRDGMCYPLSLTEEHYDVVDKALPSSWYLFSPPVTAELRAALFDAAQRFTKALGVRNGAFHIEMRVNEAGGIYAIDYSNRMGYPHLVSECCGYFFPKAYVQVMAGELPPVENPKQNTVFQRFIRDLDELERFKKLMSNHPELVIQKNMLGSYVGGVRTYARVALRHSSFEEMHALLKSYDLVPVQWSEYYGV